MLLRLAMALVLPGTFLVAQPEKTSWEILKEGLKDKNPDVRRQAVTATGSIGLAPEAIKLVEDALHDDDPLVRETAAAELGDMKSKQSIPVLRAALDDENEVAFAAAKALWDLGDRSSRPFLEDVVAGQQKTSPGVVSGAVRDAKQKMHQPKTLAMMGFREATGALLGPFNMGLVAAEDTLKDGTASARVLSVSLLAQECDAVTLQLVEKACTNDKNWAVRAAAAKALGKCHNSDAIPTLERNLSDAHPGVKFMSAAAIVRLSDAAK
ncbi:MAG TPA: HEAT repeat domain-containing protein [Bryobacteraceae bacterium]|nr:HEAT repeat domain-containing protein [Bryobacteraceae bacterium]